MWCSLEKEENGTRRYEKNDKQRYNTKLCRAREQNTMYIINNMKYNIRHMEYSNIKILTIQYNTIRYDKIQYNTIQQNTIQLNTIQYNTIKYNTIQYNIIQLNTIQYNTTQHNTIQYNTKQNNKKNLTSFFIHTSSFAANFLRALFLLVAWFFSNCVKKAWTEKNKDGNLDKENIRR